MKRDVYEESLTSVKTVKDFTLLFDAYAKMEEEIISIKMNSKVSSEQGDFDEIDIDFRLARFERLMDRRPFLLNDVLLRQNVHNVQNWMDRAQLLKNKFEALSKSSHSISNGQKGTAMSNDQKKAFENLVTCYATAVKLISPHKSDGELNQLWVDYAEIYEQQNDLEGAKNVFEKAVEVPFRRVDDLAHVWCQWAEMYLRQKKYKIALDILGRATSPRSANMSIRYNDENVSPQRRLFKCVKLWSFYVDLEESIGSYEGAKAAYDRILELKIATPQIIINYASFLEERKYFEEVNFKAY